MFLASFPTGQWQANCYVVAPAGSIGRTDLPGGDQTTMNQTLAHTVLPIVDSCALLPGHGPQTTMGRERTSNPYLQSPFLRN